MRVRIGVTSVALLTTLTILFVWAGTASAGTRDTSIQTVDPTDPQNTNVPYVAWAGETVKVTKCLNSEGLVESDLSKFSLDGTLNLSGWSGDDAAGPNTPFFLQSDSQGLSVVGTWIPKRGLCFSGLIKSMKPGLATVTLAVNGDLDHFFAGITSDGLFEHDFLVIWLQAQAPAITEVPTPGDPAGNGVFRPVARPTARTPSSRGSSRSRSRARSRSARIGPPSGIPRSPCLTTGCGCKTTSRSMRRHSGVRRRREQPGRSTASTAGTFMTTT